MTKHETKARFEAQMDEWKRNLDTMKAKVSAAGGQANVGYRENVGQLQKQFDELKISAAKSWDVADDKFDSAREEIDSAWGEWEARAKKAWDDLSK